ncbi:MAG: aminotransferase class V-fold PLP-dependent enzyme [Candidatus Woesearchaeota archaeon]
MSDTMHKRKSSIKKDKNKSRTIISDFPLIKNRKVSYLDNAATTQKPQCVIDALKEYYEMHNANSHRGLYKISEESTKILYDSRKIIAEFINANPEEIIFTKNSTEALNDVARSIEETIIITKEHNIVATIIEHHSNFIPWQQLAKRTTAEFRIVDYTIEKNKLEDIANIIDENTLIVAFTAMSNVTGMILDIKNIIKGIRKKNKNTIIIIDATQIIAHKKVDVKDLDVDFLVFSGHKMYGPTGVGVLFAKKIFLEKIAPFNYGGNMINKVELYDSNWADVPEKFEAGTQDTAAIYALSKAIEYFKKNYNKIESNEKKVQEYALKELRKIKDIKILGHNITANNGNYGPVISFTINGIHPHDLAEICDKYNVCIRAGHHCTQPLHKKLNIMATSRISIGAYNTTKDIDNLITAINYARKILLK